MFPFNRLAKYVPEHKDKAQSDHNPKDNCIPPLTEVDLVHQVVDHREFVCQIVQLGLDSLKEAGLKCIIVVFHVMIQINNFLLVPCKIQKQTQKLGINSQPTFFFLKSGCFRL